MDILKENFPNNVINDLYKLCFLKLPCIVNISSYKKKLIASITSWCEGEGNQPSDQPSLQHIAVMVKISIFRPNFS